MNTFIIDVLSHHHHHVPPFFDFILTPLIGWCHVLPPHQWSWYGRLWRVLHLRRQSNWGSSDRWCYLRISCYHCKCRPYVYNFICFNFNISLTYTHIMLLFFIFSTHIIRPSARTFMHALLETMPSAPVLPVLPNLRPTASVPKRKSVLICAPALSTLALTWLAWLPKSGSHMVNIHVDTHRVDSAVVVWQNRAHHLVLSSTDVNKFR